MHGCCADKSCTPDTCMELPDGKTCGDCLYLRRCRALGCARASQTSCDFFPRKFVAARHDDPGPQPEQTTSQELGRSMP